MAPGPRIERYIHLLLRERLGGSTPPDLSRNILDAIDGKPAVKSIAPAPTRATRPWMAIAAAVAIASAVLFGATAYTINVLKDNTPATTAGGENKVRVVPSQQDNVQDSAPKPDPAPRPEPKQPEPKPEPKLPEHIEQPKPEPKPEPTPEPEPEPKRPEGDTVEQPPTPEPQPEPTPEPKRPEGDTVEQPPAPEPEPERPPSESLPPRPVRVGTVVYMAEKARLEFRNGDEDKWQDWIVGGEVLSGMQLRARKAVALELSDGARLYFDGEVALAGDDKSFEVTLDDQSVYFDVYGSKRAYTVRRGDAALAFRDAELLVRKSGVRLQVACLGGEVAQGEDTLKAGWSASFTAAGFSRLKFEGDKVRDNDLVKAMDGTFVLMRDELHQDAAKRVYCGEWKDGVVHGGHKENREGREFKECAFGIELAKELTVQERGYLRMRVRVTGSKDGLSLGFGAGKGGEWRYFQTHMNAVPNDEWTVLRIPMSALKDEGAKKNIWPGVVLHKLQVVLWTKEGSNIEIDWLEIGVDTEWSARKDNREGNDGGKEGGREGGKEEGKEGKDGAKEGAKEGRDPKEKK